MTSHNKFFNRDEQINDFFDEESVENSLKDDEEDNFSNNDILINKYKNELSKINKKISGAKSLIKELTNEINKYKLKISDLKEEWEEKIADAKKDYTTKNDKANSFSSDTSGYKKKIDKLKEQIASLEKEYSLLKKANNITEEKEPLDANMVEEEPKKKISTKGKSALQLYNAGDRAYCYQKDYETAFSYFEESAKMGYAKAQYMTAIMYLYGQGVEVNKEMAFHRAYSSAVQEYYEAQILLANFFVEGIWTNKSPKEAYEYFLKALNNKKATNKKDAYEGMGLCYEKGYGVAKDHKNAIEFYSKIPYPYDSLRNIRIARVYYDLLKDYKNAYKFAKEALKVGKEFDKYGEIGCFLGMLYYHGRGVEQDFDKAFEYFKSGFQKSMNMGFNEVIPELNYYIGLCFVNGHGVTKDIEKGKKYLIKAEGKGYMPAVAALLQLRGR